MNLKNRKPVLMPRQVFRALEDKMTKAALFDMVWSLAGQTCECAEDVEQVTKRIVAEWEIVRRYRMEAYAGTGPTVQS